ncbi:hypothetical protein [Altericroceibacterium spongiae]|uniref:hypothetical protein n=1 Tax=Altericroceibacterium spongiae TaxID=2320269 RepID=UPI0016022F55|nr:hypothetical protein [Altericroceibacterium spongiae]
MTKPIATRQRGNRIEPACNTPTQRRRQAVTNAEWMNRPRESRSILARILGR